MPTSKSPLFAALAGTALVLSAISIVISQQASPDRAELAEAPTRIVDGAGSNAATVEQLQREVADLQFRLEILEARMNETTEASPEQLLSDRMMALELRLDDTLQVVDDLEARDQTLAEASKRKSRAIAAKDADETAMAVRTWVEGNQARLDRVMANFSDRIRLDRSRDQEMWRIVEEASQTQLEILDSLETTPAPTARERNEAYGELKAVQRERNQELAEILSPEEMRVFQEVEKTTPIDAEEDE